ncbi:hypothetical protein [Subtercola endophyticus]|uniref:hypothetical protein n=1 Tax=Subtercola endophyticus TaxID=2895559 RepID=UPI001E2DF826|nr:hypothetical protein [Subtercola endophyticus]UFS57608.1 hypothetical protein LQ955_11105 [Subtercola endophyticus]
MQPFKSAVLAVAIGATLSMCPLAARAEAPTPGADVQMMVRVNGHDIPIDAASLRHASLHSPSEAPAGGDNSSQNLLGWDQWFGCFSLNHEDDIFATYYTPSVDMHAGREINDSFGYKHIRADKLGVWTDEYDSAVAAGWNPALQNMEDWDDLMSVAAETGIEYPNFQGGSAVNNTTCVNVNLDFVKPGVGLVYTFNAIAVYSNTNDRLITAFPTTRTTC